MEKTREYRGWNWSNQGLNWRIWKFVDQLRVKMHRFKTKDQSEKDDQLQGGHSNLAGMQLNWFLKSKSQLRVWLNNSKIDWFENKTFWCPFLLKWNSVFCSKRRHFHYSLKKRATNDVVLMALFAIVFP